MLADNNARELRTLTQCRACFFSHSEFLDMSSNVLSNIENDAFHALHRLRSLDLSRNHLKDLSLKLPENMEYISLAENDIEYWPIDRLPTRLRVLQLQSNRLVGMLKSSEHQYTEVPSLELLNISHNHIDAFPSMIRFPRLKTLDASYNAFRQVPRDLGEQVPDIDSFIFRGNPIETIEFGARILAHTVDFSESTKLRRLNASNFAAVCEFSCAFLRLRRAGRPVAPQICAE